MHTRILDTRTCKYRFENSMNTQKRRRKQIVGRQLYNDENPLVCINSSLPLYKKDESNQNQVRLRLPPLNLKNNSNLKRDEFENKDSGRTKHSERASYDPEADSIIKHLTRDNTLMFSPFVIDRKNYKDSYDYSHVAEKRVVMEDFRKMGQLSKFERDELYIPQLYRKHLSCQHCRKSYVAKMFTKAYLKRNNREPSCEGMRTERRNGGHFCDVLGKKYCSQCVERENRNVLYPSQNPETLFREVSHASHTGKLKRRKIGVDMSFTFR